MKITKSRLKQIIKEELEQVMDESSMFGPLNPPTGPKPQRIRGKRRLDPEDEERPRYPKADLASIGVGDDPGENPLNPAVKAARRRLSDFALGINRKKLSPEEAKAHDLLTKVGYKYHNPQNRRIDLTKKPNIDDRLDPIGYMRSVLDKAVDRGEISFETSRKVAHDIESDYYDRIR